MTNIDSRIGATRQIAARLTKHSADVASATRKRDVCLYKFFQAILKLDKDRCEISESLRTCRWRSRLDTALTCRLT